MRVLLEARRVLGPQGYSFSSPPPRGVLDGDVAVLPLPGSPEEAAYRAVELRVAFRVLESDAWKALALAVAAPRRAYRELLIGIDPGSTCAYAAIADGVLLYAGRAPCGEVARRVSWLARWIPHERLSVNLGGGPGAGAAAAGLDSAGIPYKVVGEQGTSTRGPPPGPVWREWMDADLRASLLIALLGRHRRRVRV